MKQLTFEEAFGVNSFDLSPGPKQVVYQHGSDISLGKIGSRSHSSLEIDLSADVRFDPVVSETMTDKVDEYAVSPDGSLSVYAIRGDLFVTRNEQRGRSQRSLNAKLSSRKRRYLAERARHLIRFRRRWAE